MKTIVLVRHAKSSWDNPDWSDFERPLNKRGLRDAPYLAEVLKSKVLKPNLVISSPAIRAKTTATIFANAFEYEEKDIKFDIGLYEKGQKYVSKIISQIDNQVSSVFFFGHNPDITSLAGFLTGDYFENVPTCGIVCIDFNVQNWEQALNDNGTLRFFIFPKLFFHKENLSD
ncbi:MAG: histidine phosphatase family protein [Desulfobulbaceae bacterium]|nr:histidine phosphatase family protein [Candidatus Kapabacteria bacterium]MBS3999041.1 histidine phosphatase family protein [Desulfobulbaceae bacterium]